MTQDRPPRRWSLARFRRRPEPPPLKQERFIPYTRADVLEMCLRDGRLDASAHEPFRQLARVLKGLFRVALHEQQETLKRCYQPFDPDADTRTLDERSPEARAALQDRLVQVLTDVLERGNYQRATQAELDQAMQESSLFQIRLHINFSDFEDVLLFRRGEDIIEEEVPRLLRPGTRKVKVAIYRRVALYVKFKEAACFTKRRRRHLPFKPGSTLLKLFRNIPKADIEMLFPNSEVRMRWKDKLLMGVPAVAGGALMIGTKLGAALGFMAAMVLYWLGYEPREPHINPATLLGLIAAFAALSGYLFKQWSGYKNRKIRFMKALTDSLYFRNLDNNLGVFHHLIDAAEEEECKEALLAWYFLATEGPADVPTIDHRIEAWFADRWGCALDFEVDDALGKLAHLGLAHADGACWSALPLDQAITRLEQVARAKLDALRESDPFAVSLKP